MAVWLGLAAFELKVQGYRTRSSSGNHKVNMSQRKHIEPVFKSQFLKSYTIIDVRKYIYHLSSK